MGSSNLMDRRLFIMKAGALAAGSVVGGSFLGCQANYEIEIPCLGPAAPPTPVAGMTYIRASEIGCALDCDLSTGRNKYHGGDATDDGPKINAALAGASATNPITLIIDGSAMISGLFLPASGYWSIAGLGCGTGFFIKSGTNNDGIHNGSPNAVTVNDPGPPAPARGSSVSLSNFTLNGNKGNGHSGDSTTGASQGILDRVWYFSINLMNLNNILIENLVIVNSPAYHIRLSNVGNVTISGCVMQTSGVNTDGIHLDGPANDISISYCSFQTGDDSIALNCPEGYSGDISRVTVTNCTFNSFSLMRLYTTEGGPNKFNIDTVSLSNCNGTLTEGAFLIGLANGSNPDSVTGLTITDCNITAPTVLSMAENFGTITVNNVTFTPSEAGIQPDHMSSFLLPSQAYPGITYIGSSLSVQNCMINRTDGELVAGVTLQYNSMIKNLVFNGFSVQDAGSDSPIAELLDFKSGSIEQLVLTSVAPANILALISAGGFANIGLVSGAGVLATGWEFPDSVMANEVPYISASTGLPSIKIDGVVESYPQP
jgi:Glycosyl hydrolases family 28